MRNGTFRRLYSYISRLLLTALNVSVLYTPGDCSFTCRFQCCRLHALWKFLGLSMYCFCLSAEIVSSALQVWCSRDFYSSFFTLITQVQDLTALKLWGEKGKINNDARDREELGGLKKARGYGEILRPLNAATSVTTAAAAAAAGGGSSLVYLGCAVTRPMSIHQSTAGILSLEPPITTLIKCLTNSTRSSFNLIARLNASFLLARALSLSPFVAKI